MKATFEGPMRHPTGATDVQQVLRLWGVLGAMRDLVRAEELNVSTFGDLDRLRVRITRTIEGALSDSLLAEFTAIFGPWFEAENKVDSLELKLILSALLGWIDGILAGVGAALWERNLEAQYKRISLAPR